MNTLKTFTILEGKNVKKIKYNIMSYERMKELSVMDINKKTTQGRGKDGKGTIFDKRLGTTSYGENCNTCELNKDTDPGHYALLKLEDTPIINPLFCKFLENILLLTCFKCGSLLIHKNSWDIIKKYPRSKRIKICKKYLPKKKINNGRNCKNEDCKFNNDGLEYKNVDNIMYYKKKNESKVLYNNETIFHRLSTLNNDEIEVMGMDYDSHPKNIILRGLLIPPTVIRPKQYQVDSGKYKTQTEDNISKLLKDIIQVKIKLDEHLATPLKINKKDRKKHNDEISQSYEMLNILIKNLFTNKSTSTKILNRGTRKVLSAYSGQLDKKDGLIKGNCMGKRKNFAARSPINGDKSIEIDEYGVPMYTAMKLLREEVVHKYNIERLRTHVRNGNNIYPGAAKVVKKNGNIHHTLSKKNNLNKNIAKNLKYGDIVFRHIIDGDYILPNRQPSLHKLSMMSHRAVVLSDGIYSFRIHMQATSPYNADFDGDEMNIHMTNKEPGIIECMELISIKNNLLDMNGSLLAVGPIQDDLIGIYIITKNAETSIDKNTFMNIVITGKYVNYKYINSLQKYKYIDILNSIFPETFNFKQGDCIIKMGKWVSGLIDKTKIYEIIKLIIHDFGNDVAIKFEFALQNVIDEFLAYHGLTLSLNDFVVPKKIKKEIEKNLTLMTREATELTNKYGRGEIKQPSHDKYESDISSIIDKYYPMNNDIIKEYVETKRDDGYINNFVNEYKSKAKAKLINVQQMLGVVGQQRLGSERIQKKYNKRTFPHFTKYSENLKSRGFVYNSFINGLDGIEYFTLSQVGRDSITDTALQTADTGYSNNQSVKSLESDVVSYDVFIRNNNRKIICFTFGSDGFDTKYKFNYNIDKLHNIYENKSLFSDLFI